jgi:adenosylmethionine-8-amino-7-oxononanoate aminotransferase
VRPGLPGTPAGQDGDHLQISPPYIIDEEHIDIITDVLDEVLP